MSQASETAKLLSTLFVEEAVRATATGAGFITGILSVVSLWALMGEHVRFFNIEKRCCPRRRDEE